MLVGFDTNVLVYTLQTPGNHESRPSARLGEPCCGQRIGRAAFAVAYRIQPCGDPEASRGRQPGASPHCRVSARCRGPRAGDDDLTEALSLVRDHRLAFWDALMCATASRVGLNYLLSEDMQDGRRLGGLTIVNPFRAENAALIDRILPP